MNPIFLDFEASGLHWGSYPIEIGWVSASGEAVSHLIRPAPEWLLPTPLSSWSQDSERIHGIPFDTLLAEGVNHRVVAAQAAAAFDRPGIVLVADSKFDGVWLDCLLQAAGEPKRFAIVPVQEVFAHPCRPLLRLLPSHGSPARLSAESKVEALATSIIARCEELEERRSGTRHRALPDAISMWRTWRAISAEAATASLKEVG